MTDITNPHILAPHLRCAAWELPFEAGEDTFVMDRPELGTITTWRAPTIDTAQATLTQNVSPTAVLQLSLYGQVLDGKQSNPYRAVRIGPNEPQENIPTTRARGRVPRHRCGRATSGHP